MLILFYICRKFKYICNILPFTTLCDENNDVAATDFCNALELGPHDILKDKAWTI